MITGPTTNDGMRLVQLHMLPLFGIDSLATDIDKRAKAISLAVLHSIPPPPFLSPPQGRALYRSTYVTGIFLRITG